MLKRVITAAVGVVGLVLVGLGVASATLWKADATLVATTQVGAHTYVTDPGVLELGGDPATVHVTAPGKGHVVLAVGRDTDVAGWVGTDAHARVTGLSSWHQLEVTSVAAKPTPAPTGTPAAPGAAAATPAPSPTAGAASAPQVADPTGSDLWVAEASGDGSATLKWTAQPGRWSLLAVGTQAPPTLEISWPRVVTTPYLWPLVVVGTFLFLAALFVFLWDERRRHRGGEAMWVPVTTGAVPALKGSGEPTGPLTRRQLREAAQAHAAALGQDAPAPAGGSRVTSGERAAVPVNPPGRPGSDAPSPSHPAEPAPVTAPTSRRALRAAAAGASEAPTQQLAGPVVSAPQQLSGPPPTGPSTSAALGGPGPSARPAWVPLAPPAEQHGAPSGRPDAAAPPTGQHPRWLGTAAPTSAASAGSPASPASSAAPTEPGAGSTLPPPVPQRPTDADATANGDDAGAGSRADAWRRAWGLPPTEQDDAPRGEGRHGR